MHKYTNLCIVVCLLLVMFSVCCYADLIPIDDFKDVGIWSLNEDGGGIDISAGKVTGPNGESTLGLVFSMGENPWGNAKRVISIPGNATGIEFDLYVNNSSEASAMHVWLMEADGDGYVAQVKTDSGLNQLSKGWHKIYVPFGSFRYEARGNGARQFLTVNKLMLGLNYANTGVCVANMAFRTVSESIKPIESKTVNLVIDKAKRGNVAILQGDFGKSASFSDPKVITGTLKKAGFGVTMLTPGDMSDPAILNRKNFDCLIFPYGPNYPYPATDSIRSFLKAGGGFVSMGGYAFDKPCIEDASGKMVGIDSTVTASDIDKQSAGTKWMNTRNGTYGDTMGLHPDQIGVFDPCYPLDYVASYRSARMQYVVSAALKGSENLGGYAACSLLGSDSPVFPVKWGRHISLIQGFDRDNRYRGDVGSIAHNYAGPYKGSSWAFFGVNNQDLFTAGSAFTKQLPAIVDAVVKKVYLNSLHTGLACYKDGEKAKIVVNIANFGKSNLNASVAFQVTDRGGKSVFKTVSASSVIKAGKNGSAACVYAPAKYASDLYKVTASLIVAGKTVDNMETGFVAYSKKVTSGGFDINLKNNYFQDKDRPVFLSGTNQTGMVFYSGTENPLVWDRDLAKMRESGVNVMRILHFSPFMHDDPNVAVKPIELDIKQMPVKTERQLDALVQLCQKHKVVLFLSIHDWMPQDLTDRELDAQRNYAKMIAARYKDVPGIMIDIQNEPMIEIRGKANPDEIVDVLREWNKYLKDKYGNDETLNAAWRLSPPEASIGSVPYSGGTDAWDDVRTFDTEYFRQVLLNRWIKANAEGAKSGDPNMLVTVGLLQDYGASNKLVNTADIDYANMHSYSGIDVLRADAKLFDRRFEGKSISLGEFGSMVDHDRRAHGQDSGKLDYNRYLQVGHYIFGMGGSMVANWSWKEMDDAVFPWGINYQCGGPAKSIALAYRNQSLLFRQVKPEYRSSKTFMVVPLDQMMGGKRGNVIPMLYKTVNTLYRVCPDLGIIDDKHLAILPDSVETLIYPIPYNMSDEVYEKVKAFVQRGGRLYVTGDMSYDVSRNRTMVNRLKELCGVRFVSDNYPCASWQNDSLPQINVEAAGAQLQNGVYVNKTGSGEVYFSPAPFNESMLLTAGVNGARSMESDGCHIYSLNEIGSGMTFIAVNPENTSRKVTARHAGTAVEIVVDKGKTGLIRIDRSGKVLAVESHGLVNVNGSEVFNMKGHFALSSLDKLDLRKSQKILVLPFGEGEMELPARLKGLNIQRGEIVGGKWVNLGKAGKGKINVASETEFDMFIVSPEPSIANLSRQVAAELLLK